MLRKLLLLLLIPLLQIIAQPTISKNNVDSLSTPVDVIIGENGLQTVISLGTPGQDFNVILDSNFAGLWVPGSDCNKDYDGGSCERKNMFDRKKSFTYTRKVF